MLEILKDAVSRGSIDIFLFPGAPVTYRHTTELVSAGDYALQVSDIEGYLDTLYTMVEGRTRSGLENNMEDSFSVSVAGIGRFRINIFKQRGSYSIVIRIFKFGIPNANELGIPDQVMNLHTCRGGIIVIAGTAGGGKTTTLACLLDKINRTSRQHIITLERPIEFLHQHEKGLISQREIPTDAVTMEEAFDAALWQSPDIIVVSEITNRVMMDKLIYAAETGKTVITTVSAFGVSKVLERIMEWYPVDLQANTRKRLANSIIAITSQVLVPTVLEGTTAVFEVAKFNQAIRSNVINNSLGNINLQLKANIGEDMCTLEHSASVLQNSGIISRGAYSQVTQEYAGGI